METFYLHGTPFFIFLRFASLCCAMIFCGSLFSQVAINKDGGTSTDTTAMLEIKKAARSKLKVRSLNYLDTAVLELSNRNTNNEGTDFLITARREQGLYFTTASDLPGNINDSLLILRTNGNVGIGKTNPLNKLDVSGNINVTGTIKANGVTGQPNQVLGTNEAGSLAWMERTGGATGANVGFGSWGDCSMNNISEYNPVADDNGAAGDFFGSSVSISGNFAIVGAALDDVGANSNQGSASIYQFNGSNWVFMQKITDATGGSLDNFGQSVSISGNYAIVGAYADDVGANTNQGSVSIYQYNGSTWVLMQKITDATGAAGDEFGISVSISGNYALVGANRDDVGVNTNQGSVSIYQYNGSTWVLMQKITDATGAADDGFGSSVTVSGNNFVAGAPFDDVGSFADQGSVSIYQYNGSSWVLVQKITDPNGSPNYIFGMSVCVSGNYFVVGAPGTGAGSGMACIYQYNGSSWILTQRIFDANPSGGETFGNAVSISDSYLIIGERYDVVGSTSGQGSATVYMKLGNIWQKYQYITDPGGMVSDNFGGSLSVDGITKRFLIGASQVAGDRGKVVFGKIN